MIEASQYSSAVKTKCSAAYETKYGRMYCGRAEEVLRLDPLVRLKGRVQLIFTSPPFPLNTKKKYGNLKGEKYLDWLCSFGPLFREYLSDNGSLVVELGNGGSSAPPKCQHFR